MRLAHLTWLLSPAGGGIPPVVLPLAAEQRRAGHDVRVFGVADPAARVEVEGVACFPSLGPVGLGFAPGLSVALGRSDRELVHLHGLFTWSSQVASEWARRTRGPTVVSPHGMFEPWALANSAWKKRLFRWAVEDRNLARARCLHALCAAEARSLRRLGFRVPIAVIPNGVSLENIPADHDPSPLAAMLPEIAGRRVLLFLGRLHPKKGLLELLEAWRAVRDGAAAGSWALVIAGPDQRGHGAEVARRARELGLERDVIMPGPLHGPAKRAALGGASAFVLPSHSEGFSIAVLEAMASRLPVLVSRSCNLDVEAPGAGLLCDPEPRSIAASLARLFERSESERRALGDRGRSEVERCYTWPRIARMLTGVYDWLLGGGPRPCEVEP